MLPIKIISEANRRECWPVKAARVKAHRSTARHLMQRYESPPGVGPVSITLTRVAPRVLDDDNLASGFKATRDGVADWLGIDDGHPSLSWRYAQRKGKTGQYAAEVAVQWEVQE